MNRGSNVFVSRNGTCNLVDSWSLRGLCLVGLLSCFFMSCCQFDRDFTDEGNIETFQAMFSRGSILYEVDAGSITTYDYSDSASPEIVQRLVFNFEVQYANLSIDHIIVMSDENLHVLEIGPLGIPVMTMVVSHQSFERRLTICDQLLFDQDILYVSPSESSPISTCFPASDNTLRLYVVDALESPRLVDTKLLTAPGKMLIDGVLLFVADGNGGVRVYDRTNPADIKEINHIAEQIAVDIALRDNLLTVLGKDDVRVYNYSNPSDISLVSIFTI